MFLYSIFLYMFIQQVFLPRVFILYSHLTNYIGSNREILTGFLLYEIMPFLLRHAGILVD